MKELLKIIDKHKDVISNYFDDKFTVYPFDKITTSLVKLVDLDLISFDEYTNIIEEYKLRNKNVLLYQITSPTEFGITWAQTHILKNVSNCKPSTNGSYDILIDNGIRIEVKASRAVKYKTSGPLTSKMLDSSSNEKFDMNFQQIKTDCCDVVIFIGVWSNVIKYWVIPSDKLKTIKYYSDKQHKGNSGEGQLHFKENNIKSFDEYLSTLENIGDSIKNLSKDCNK